MDLKLLIVLFGHIPQVLRFHKSVHAWSVRLQSLETKHDKMKAMHQEAQKTQKHLETRLSQEEVSSMILVT